MAQGPKAPTTNSWLARTNHERAVGPLGPWAFGAQGTISEDFGITAFPSMLVSVPNQIVLVALSYTMCRIVPPPLGSTGVLLKNFSVLGSKPTSMFGFTPVSTNQIRS